MQKVCIGVRVWVTYTMSCVFFYSVASNRRTCLNWWNTGETDVIGIFAMVWLEQGDMWSVAHPTRVQIYSRNGVSFYRSWFILSAGPRDAPPPPRVEMWAVVSRMICTCVKSKSPPGPLPGFPWLTNWASHSRANTKVQRLAAQHHKQKMERKEWKEERNIETHQSLLG